MPFQSSPAPGRVTSERRQENRLVSEQPVREPIRHHRLHTSEHPPRPTWSYWRDLTIPTVSPDWKAIGTALFSAEVRLGTRYISTRDSDNLGLVGRVLQEPVHRLHIKWSSEQVPLTDINILGLEAFPLFIALDALSHGL